VTDAAVNRRRASHRSTRAKINARPYFVHFLSDFDKIWYRGLPQKSSLHELFLTSWTLVYGKPYFFFVGVSDGILAVVLKSVTIRLV